MTNSPRISWLLCLCAGVLLASCAQEDASVQQPSIGNPGDEVVPVPDLFAYPIGPEPGSLVERVQGPENPYEGERPAIQQGRELFLAYNCYGCHGGRAGGGMGPSLRDDAWLYGGTAPAIFSSIAQGRPHSMPAWGDTLPDEILWQLTAYIQSLGTELEPNAPRPR